MKQPLTRSINLVALSLLLGCTANAEIVYNNSSNLFLRFNPGTAEVGDEVVLAGSARTITNFVFEYWGENFDGNETARIRFYANDGTNAPGSPTAFVPETLLFDSGDFSITATPRETKIFNLAALSGGVLVPDSFTWSVQFGGVTDGSERAGVDLYDPPTVGGNYLDYWDNAGSFNWELRAMTVDGTNPPANFGAFIEAVPEPSVLMLGLLGGLAVLGWRKLSQRR